MNLVPASYFLIFDLRYECPALAKVYRSRLSSFSASLSDSLAILNRSSTQFPVNAAARTALNIYPQAALKNERHRR